MGHTLNDILTMDVYRFMLIFTRVGTALMMFPGFSGALFPVRTRLLLGLVISFALLPVIGALIPRPPSHVGALIAIIFGEVTAGTYLGLVTQIMMGALSIAGTFIGFQIGLTNAFSFDSVAAQQSSTMTAFLSNLALMAIFTTDLHHLMLRALADSYATFGPGMALPLDGFMETIGHLMSDSFGFGVRLASPVIAFGLIYYAGLGLMARLSPQIQVFFIVMPIQVLSGFMVFSLGLAMMIHLFLQWFESGLIPFLNN